MRVPYAWLDLVHDRGRTAIAVLGVAFAVLLILMQLGFYGSVRRTAVLIHDNMLFDVLICSRNYRFLTSPDSIPRERMQQARGVAGVAAVAPFNLSFTTWRPSGPDRRRPRAIMLLGLDLDRPTIDLARIEADAELLRLPGAVLIDRKSRPEFGSQAGGTPADAGAIAVTVAGTFDMGTGFGADGAIMTSAPNFSRIQPGFPSNRMSFALVTVTDPADVEGVASRLRERLPADVRVLTRDELDRAERHHWIAKTSVGVIFGMGVATSLVVGIAIVSQVLTNKVTHHFREFATMKALGYSQGYISRVVLAQAVVIAILGYVPGLLVAWQLYGITRGFAHIPMRLGLVEATTVLVLAMMMCVLAAVAALRKVARAAPADLF
jgi:putative ABC transport system permease protein